MSLKTQDGQDWIYIFRYQTININWDWISQYQKLSEQFIEKFQDRVSWDYISAYQELSEEFIEKYGDKRFIRLNVDKLKMNQISIRNIPFFEISIKNEKYDIKNLFDSISSIYFLI